MLWLRQGLVGEGVYRAHGQSMSKNDPLIQCLLGTEMGCLKEDYKAINLTFLFLPFGIPSIPKLALWCIGAFSN